MYYSCSLSEHGTKLKKCNNLTSEIKNHSKPFSTKLRYKTNTDFVASKRSIDEMIFSHEFSSVVKSTLAFSSSSS